MTERLWGAAPALLVGAASFLLAASNLLPGVGFWDTAEFQTVGPILGVAHPTGYPTYVILGWFGSILLAPFGDPATRMNLLSALCLAAAAGLTVGLVRRLTDRTMIGLAAGLGLAATPIAWRIGTRADAHALHLALVALLFVCLAGWAGARARDHPRADRWLLGAAAVFAVSLGNHSLTALLAPGIALYLVGVDPRLASRRRMLAACGAIVVGLTSLVYLELPLRAGPFRAPLVYGAPQTLEGFVYVVLGEQFRSVVGSPLDDIPGKLDGLFTILGVQFGPIAALLPAGLVATVLRRPAWALLTVPSFTLTVLFAASYTNAEIDRYYLVPLLIAWSWLAIGAATIVELVAGSGTADGGGWAGGTLSRWTAAGALELLLAATLVAPAGLDLAARSRVVAASGLPSARPWLEAALAAFEPDAVVVSWWSYSTPLWYAQHIEGRRTDISVVDDRTRIDEGLGEFTDVIDRYLGRRPVYAIRVDQRDLATLATRYRLERLPLPTLQPVFRVAGHLAARP